MRAMLLAAGLGTRLRPLTVRRPKCLMPVMNRPLLSLWHERLAKMGVTRAVVNTHHLAGQVRAWLQGQDSTLEMVESHEPEILGTGGGLVAARGLLGDDVFLLVNADVLATADLRRLCQARARSQALAVLGLVDHRAINTVALDKGNRVLGFKGQPGLATAAAWRTYSGLAALHPRLLDFLPPRGYATLVGGLKAAIAAGELVEGLNLSGFWDDLGTPGRLWALHRDLVLDPPPDLASLAPGSNLVLGPGAELDPGAEVNGFCVLGAGARVAAGAEVHDSVLLPGARAAAGSQVSQAILGDGFVARGPVRGGAHG